MFGRAQGLQGGGLRVRARICNPALRISQFRIRCVPARSRQHMSVMVTDADTDRSAGEAVAQLPIEPPTDYSAWLRLRPLVARELLLLARAGSLPTGAALKRVCRKLFGTEC